MAGSTVKQLSAVCLRQPLQQRASFYCQNIQRYFQLIDSGSKFWVSSNLLLKRIQNLLSAGNMLGGFGGILLGVAFALRFHGYSLLCSILNQDFPFTCASTQRQNRDRLSLSQRGPCAFTKKPQR